MMCGVYIIRNIINNKIYIGKSLEVEIRLSQHRANLRGGYHHNPYLQKAFNKYGEENFEFELLEEYNEDCVESLENYWCNLLNVHNKDFGYNIEPTGPNGARRLAEETKHKISNLKKELYKDPQNNPFFGKSHSQETKDKMSAKGKGVKKKPWSEETRRKILNSRAQTYKTKRDAKMGYY